MLATLGAIQETVLFYKADRDRPRARRMITEMNPIQQGLDDGFGLGTYAPKRWDRCYNCSPRMSRLTSENAEILTEISETCARLIEVPRPQGTVNEGRRNRED
jgi:hypothetical protein